MDAPALKAPTQDAVVSGARPLVRIEGLGFSYPNGVEALRGADLEIHEGEIVSLVGPSGCGKSTLISVLANLRQAAAGRIDWNPEAMADLSSGTRRQLNVVFQKDTVLPWLTVEKHIAFGLKYLKLSREEKRERVETMLELGGLTGARRAYARELSGGMLRRVALLTGMATYPKLLVLDEPFSALDEPTRIGIHQELFDMSRRLGVAVLLITHDLGEATSLSHRVGVMSRRPARVVHIEPIPLGEARSIAHVRSEDTYQRAYQRLWEILWQQIEGAADGN